MPAKAEGGVSQYLPSMWKSRPHLNLTPMPQGLRLRGELPHLRVQIQGLTSGNHKLSSFIYICNMKQKLGTNTHTLTPLWGRELGQGHLAGGLEPQAQESWRAPLTAPQGWAPAECRFGRGYRPWPHCPPAVDLSRRLGARQEGSSLGPVLPSRRARGCALAHTAPSVHVTHSVRLSPLSM